MEIDESKPSRTAAFVTTLVFLAVMAGGMIAMFIISTGGADNYHASPVVTNTPATSPTTMAATSPTTFPLRQSPEYQAKKLLTRLAWVSIAMLGLTVVMIFWVVIRFLTQRFAPSTQHQHTPYVDAWKLAGQRVKPEEEDEQSGEDSNS